MDQLLLAISQNDAISFSQLAARNDLSQPCDEDQRTPLMVAAAYGQVELVKIALQHGADVNAEDVGGRTALLIAAAEGQTAVVEHLIQIDPTSIDACTSSGNTALHRAAAYGHAAVVRALIKGGAVIDSLNEEGSTPLARACRWGHDDVVKTLVHAGADPSVADRSGRTPAQWASLKGWTEVTAAMANERPHAHHLSKSANTVSLRGQGLLPGGTTSSSPSGTASVAQADPIAEVDHPMDGDEDDDDVHGSGGAGQYGGPVRVEGWMAKQGHFIRNWKNRWFSLEGRRIYYFGKEGAAKPKGCINMVAGTDVIIEERYSKPYCFTLITPTKKFILQAANEEEMVEWLEAIQTNLEAIDPADMDHQTAVAVEGGDDD